MKHPNFWGAVASHSGDADFDLLYRSDLPKAASALARFDGDPVAFISHLQQQPKVDGKDFYALMLLAMAASYDPQPELPMGIQFPADVRTCALDAESWARWKRWDPLTLAAPGSPQQPQPGSYLLLCTAIAGPATTGTGAAHGTTPAASG